MCFGFPSTQTWHFGKNKKKVFLKNDLRTVYKLFSQVSCRWKWFLKCRCHSVNLCMPVVVFMNVLVLCCFYYSLFFIKLLQFNFRFILLLHFFILELHFASFPLDTHDLNIILETFNKFVTCQPSPGWPAHVNPFFFFFLRFSSGRSYFRKLFTWTGITVLNNKVKSKGLIHQAENDRSYA